MDPRQSTFEALARFLDKASTAVSGVTTAVGGLATSLAAVASAAVSRRVDTTFPLAGGGALTADLTLTVANATSVSVGVLGLIGDISGSATNVVVSGINGATAPGTPVAADVGKAIAVSAAGVYSLRGVEDFGWSTWCSKVTVEGGDTSKLLYSLDLTDTSKASTNYLIVAEFEVILDTTDTAHLGFYRVNCCYEAWFNGSGAPSFGTISPVSGGVDDIYLDHSGSPGIPTITAVSPSASGSSITLTLTKPSSGDDTYAQTRSRLVVVKEAT
jgi:hypothetical protein